MKNKNIELTDADIRVGTYGSLMIGGHLRSAVVTKMHVECKRNVRVLYETPSGKRVVDAVGTIWRSGDSMHSGCFYVSSYGYPKLRDR